MAVFWERRTIATGRELASDTEFRTSPGPSRRGGTPLRGLMARALTDSRDFFGALGRAYALGDEHPPHHPAVRVALAEAMTTLHAGARAFADITTEGISVQGDPVGAPGRALATALAAAGVKRISIAERARTEALETLLHRIREANGNPFQLADVTEFEGTGLSLSLVDGPPRPDVPSSEARSDSSIGVRDAIDAIPVDPTTSRLGRSIAALFVETPSGPPNGALGVLGSSRNGAGALDPGSADLEAQIAAYVGRPDIELANQIEESAADLDSEEALDRVVDAVRVLAEPVGREGRDHRFGLARRLGSTDVHRRLIRTLTESTDPKDHTELTRIVVGVGASISDDLVAAIAEAQDPGVRRVLLETMVALGAVGRESVQRMLDDQRWFVVRNGVRLLPDVAGKGAVTDLVRVTTHEEPRVRREAITALARTGTPEAARALFTLVDDTEPAVRVAAAAALGVIEVADRGAVLLQRLQLEVQPEVHVALMRALASVGHEPAVPELERRATRGLFTRRPQNQRLEAIKALWAIGTPRARAVVMATLDDRDPGIKGAVRALLGGH